MKRYHHFSLFGYRFRWWVYRGEYSLSKNGKWPVKVWFTGRGFGFHGGNVADAHIEEVSV